MFSSYIIGSYFIVFDGTLAGIMKKKGFLSELFLIA
jgi:hypothetical protein